MVHIVVQTVNGYRIFGIGAEQLGNWKPIASFDTYAEAYTFMLLIGNGEILDRVC